MGRSPRSRTIAFVLLVAGAALGGCGSNEDPTSLTRNKERPGTGSKTTTSDDGESVAPPEGAFDYAADLALLPFDVRLAKVASVAGVASDDPALATLYARRFDLGDHDYAKGVKPDLTWSVTRMGTWVKALRPVCASQAMRGKYPALPEKLGDLFLAAYGREVTDEDRAVMNETVKASALDSESQYQVICLAVLTSLEFVAR